MAFGPEKMNEIKLKAERDVELNTKENEQYIDSFLEKLTPDKFSGKRYIAVDMGKRDIKSPNSLIDLYARNGWNHVDIYEKVLAMGINVCTDGFVVRLWFTKPTDEELRHKPYRV